MARKSATAKAASATAAKQQSRATVVIAVTPDFKKLLESKATEQNISVSTYAAGILGCTLGVTYAVPARAAKSKKYATKELAKAAQAANAKARNATMAALLKALKAGEISNDVLAKWAKSA